jgi:hypothetical protein
MVELSVAAAALPKAWMKFPVESNSTRRLMEVSTQMFPLNRIDGDTLGVVEMGIHDRFDVAPVACAEFDDALVGRVCHVHTV